MYYIYCHKDPITQNIFYIGKGTKSRAFSLKSRNNHHFNKLQKLIRQGFSIKQDIVHFIETNIIDETEAYSKEKVYIEQLKQQNTLLNITPGGLGGVGSAGLIGPTNPGWIEIDKFVVLNYLKQGLNIKQIAKNLNCCAGLIKKKCYIYTNLQTFCKEHGVIYKNHMAKNISEDDFKLQLIQGKTSKEIAKYFGVNLNYFKINFYPNITLKEYCDVYNIPYTNTQSNTKNGNYKEIDYTEFVKMVKNNLPLVHISKKMGISSRCLIKKYREKFNVSSWLQLKAKICN